MAARTGAERPEELAVVFGNRQVVDGSVADRHQAVFGKLPIFVSVGAKPPACVVVPLVSKADGNAAAAECPQLFDQSVVSLTRPFLG